MNKIFGIFILLFGIYTTAKSQHCGWDNCYVIILDVRDSLTEEIINDLEITLTDPMGKPYTSKWNFENRKETSIYQKTDTLKFGQNSENNIPKRQADNIPFGQNCYMLLVYRNNYPSFNESGTDKIFIKDNKGQYESSSITFDRNKITEMCTNNPIWQHKKPLKEKTIEIKLLKKK